MYLPDKNKHPFFKNRMETSFFKPAFKLSCIQSYMYAIRAGILFPMHWIYTTRDV